MQHYAKPALVISQGDPSGVGPETVLKAWLARREEALPPFCIASDPAFLSGVAEAMGLAVTVVATTPDQVASVFDNALPVLPMTQPVRAKLGQPDQSTARGTIESIETGVRLIHAGQCSALVTAPIAKSVLYAAGFAHPGHTEFLAELAERHWGHAVRPVMLIWSELLSVVPITIHIPLAEVPRALTRDLVLETARIVQRDWQLRFGVSPRMVVAGLNPHAGESGTIGMEDEAVLRPAVETLRNEGLDIRGPLPADTLFHPRARAGYDVALCPYHDQALIPVKTLAFDDGVNVTLGLPFVRTSPDHGTAFDIAGQGIARPDSMIAAIKLAGRMVARAEAARA